MSKVVMSCSDVLNLALPVFCHAKEQPAHAALVVDEKQYSYADLASAAARVAAWLKNGSLAGRPIRVGILAARSFETYAGILGAAWAGGTYVPLNPKQPASRLRFIVEKAGLSAVIADHRGAVHLKELEGALPAKVLLSEGMSTLLSGDADTAPPAAVAPDHIAYIIFTSGTTGVPKGVAVSVSNVKHFLACERAMYHIRPADRVAQFFETSFDVSVSEMFACWDGGAALHVVPENKVMAPAGFLRQHEITYWQSVPSAIMVMSRLKQLQPNSFPALRVAIFGGEGFTLELARAFQEAAPNSFVDNHYGPTEATVACTYQRLTDPPVLTPERGTLSIGKPFAGTQAAIVGPAMNFLGADEIGELVLSGPQVALGYFGDDQQTSRRFPTLNHPRLGTSRWYLSGDLAFYDQDGNFHHLGRVDNQVKVMGHRVELEEIEAHLRVVCRTDEVAAVAWPVVNGQPAGIVAFVCGGGVQPAQVREELRSRMPAYMIPAKVLPMEALPLSTNGKVDRHVLRSFLEQKTVELEQVPS
jgi:D-alanine--poly(phosphoribitol) ligase subunit 1